MCNQSDREVVCAELIGSGISLISTALCVSCPFNPYPVQVCLPLCCATSVALATKQLSWAVDVRIIW